MQKKMYFLGFALLFLALSLWIWKENNVKRPDMEHIQQRVQRACQEDNFPLAISILEDAVRYFPEIEQNYPMRNLLVQLYLRQKEYALAERHLQLCVEGTGPLPHLMLWKGKIEKESGRMKKAVETFQKIVSERPDFLPARIELVEAFLERSEVSRARSQLTEIREAGSPAQLEKFPQIDYAKARLLALEGKLSQALAQMDHFLAMRPTVFSAQKEWLELMAEQGKLEEARSRYKAIAHSSSPNSLFFQHLYSLTLSPPQKIEYLKELLANSRNRALLMEFFSTLIKEGKYEEAIREMKTDFSQDPQVRYKISQWEAYAYLMSGQWERGEALSRKEDDFPSLSNLVSLALSREDYAQAFSWIEKLEGCDWREKERDEIEFLKVKTSCESGQFEAALASCAKLAERFPPGSRPWARILFQRGQAHLEKGDYTDASHCFQKVAEGQSNPALRLRAALWNGACLYRTGRDPLPWWKRFADFPWREYLADDREAACFSLLLEGKTTGLDVLKGIPWLENDVHYWFGVRREIEGDREEASAEYEKGTKTSVGREFPWHELTRARRRLRPEKG